MKSKNIHDKMKTKLGYCMCACVYVCVAVVE